MSFCNILYKSRKNGMLKGADTVHTPCPTSTPLISVERPDIISEVSKEVGVQKVGERKLLLDSTKNRDGRVEKFRVWIEGRGGDRKRPDGSLAAVRELLVMANTCWIAKGFRAAKALWSLAKALTASRDFPPLHWHGDRGQDITTRMWWMVYIVPCTGVHGMEEGNRE